MAKFYIQLADKLLSLNSDITSDVVVKALGYAPSNFSGKFSDLTESPILVNESFNILNENNEVVAKFGENQIVFPKEKADTLIKEGYIGKNVIFGIRPEHLSDDVELIEANPNSIVKGNVEVIELMGAESYIYTKCGKDSLNIRVEGTTNLKVGEVAKLYLRSEKLHVFDKEAEIRIV